MAYTEMRNLMQGQIEIVGKTKAEIFAAYGDPDKIHRYEIDGQERERFSYYFEEPDFIKRKLLLEVYFLKDVVSGFNIYSGDKGHDGAEMPEVSDRFLFGQM